MSEKDVKKIAFCSLDEYKTIQKEEGTEYIIDAADISEAITNSDAIDPGHTAENHPPKEEVYKFPVFVRRFFVQKESDEEGASYFCIDVHKTFGGYKQELKSDNYFYLEKSHFSNIDFSTNVHVEHIVKTATSYGKKYYIHYFKMTPHSGAESLAFTMQNYKSKYNIYLSTSLNVPSDYIKIYESYNLDNISIYNEELDLEPYIYLDNNKYGYTQPFIIEATSEEIPEQYREKFEEYKHKLIDHFNQSKMKFYVIPKEYGKYINIDERDFQDSKLFEKDIYFDNYNNVPENEDHLFLMVYFQEFKLN